MDTKKQTLSIPTKPAILIETQRSLETLATQLLQQPKIAVDTEANSLHAYREQVCLIQFSIPGSDYLVDPLALTNLDALAPVFASETVEKVFHAADYDLIVLHRDYSMACGKLFDTMWAGRVLGWPRVGLGNILKDNFGIAVDKKFQRYNWGRRPLTAEAITYARMDTHYLLKLRALQIAELKRLHRWQEAQEIFDYLRCHVPEPSPLTPATTFWRIKGLQHLNIDEQRVLYQIHLWREHTAESLDRPPFKVMNNRRLVTLAQIRPTTRQGLQNAGLTPYQIRRFGKDILHALRVIAATLPPRPSEHKRPPDAVMERYNALHAWRKAIAAGRGVDSDVILPNATLWELAWRPPQTRNDLLKVPGIGPWRQNTYGADILELT